MKKPGCDGKSGAEVGRKRRMMLGRFLGGRLSGNISGGGG